MKSLNNQDWVDKLDSREQFEQRLFDKFPWKKFNFEETMTLLDLFWKAGKCYIYKEAYSDIIKDHKNMREYFIQKIDDFDRQHNRLYSTAEEAINLAKERRLELEKQDLIIEALTHSPN